HTIFSRDWSSDVCSSDLHTLRIFLFKQEKEDIQRINEKELLEIFDKHFLKSNFIDEKSVIEFIETLFEVRYAFDRYVIKWVTVRSEERRVGKECRAGE